MPRPNQITFEQAIAESAEGKRNLLLGNGFSAAWSGEFVYRNLRTKAAELGLLSEEVVRLFDALGTDDFEEIVSWLEGTARNLPAIYPDEYEALVTDLREKAEATRSSLIEVLKHIHPDRPLCRGDAEHPTCLTGEQYTSCINFLRYFRAADNAGHVFSTNYDLLLYWVHMEDLQSRGNNLNLADGFTREEDTLIWKENAWPNHPQNIHYLHGAFYMVNRGQEVVKLKPSSGRATIIEELDASGRMPLYVSEGLSKAKRAKIAESSYLNYCLRELRNLTGSIFIYGFSADERDQHILQAIKDSHISNVYLGLRGAVTQPKYQAIYDRFNSIKTHRPDHNPLELKYFDSREKNPWQDFAEDANEENVRTANA